MARKDLHLQWVYEPNEYGFKWLKSRPDFDTKHIELGRTKEGVWYYRRYAKDVRLMFVYHSYVGKRKHSTNVKRPISKSVWAAYCAEKLVR